MKGAFLAGIVLVALGILALVYQGITYTKRDAVINVGPIHATAEHQRTVPIPPILGAVSVVAGVLLVVVGVKK